MPLITPFQQKISAYFAIKNGVEGLKGAIPHFFWGSVPYAHGKNLCAQRTLHLLCFHFP